MWYRDEVEGGLMERVVFSYLSSRLQGDHCMERKKWGEHNRKNERMQRVVYLCVTRKKRREGRETTVHVNGVPQYLLSVNMCR